MPADEIDDENEAFTTPHLPERYHLAVKAKKQRRLKRNLLTIGGVLIGIILLYLLISAITGGIYSGMSLSGPVIVLPSLAMGTPAAGENPAVNVTNETPLYLRGPGLTGPLPAGIVPADKAFAAIKSDYPAPGFTVTRADLVSLSGRPLYVFTIRETGDPEGTVSTTYINAMTGTAYSPGEEQARILRADAANKALTAFPDLHPDRVVLEYSQDRYDGKIWKADLYREGRKSAAVSFDADTGDLLAFLRYPEPDIRPVLPALDDATARSIADRYIIDRNGGQLPLNMSLSRYIPFNTVSGPVAGQYALTYERTYQDYLTDMDGFVVTVDAATGDVIGYTRRWTTPDHAFAAVTEPDIMKREATFAVLQKAKEQFPADVDSLRIISAEIRWKNRVPSGTIPRPGTIPLGWKVVFDDAVIRANATVSPGVAWVDIQSGSFISFEYQH